MLVIGLGFGLTAWAHNVPVLVLSVAVWTFGEILGSPVGLRLCRRHRPPALARRYQGAWGLTWGAASILGPVLGTRLYAWSPDGFWSLCAGLGAVAAGLVLIGREPVRVAAG